MRTARPTEAECRSGRLWLRVLCIYIYKKKRDGMKTEGRAFLSYLRIPLVPILFRRPDLFQNIKDKSYVDYPKVILSHSPSGVTEIDPPNGERHLSTSNE